MQPESNEEREERDVRYVRRAMGLPVDERDDRIDDVIRYHLKHHFHYERVALEVNRELGLIK